MNDNNQRMAQSLKHELQAVKPANPLIKERIDHLNNELNQYISDPNPNRKDSDNLPALQKALQDAIESFEGHHPDLTEALRIAINTLVNAGI